MRINCNDPENVEKVVEAYKKYRREQHRKFSFLWCTMICPFIILLAVPMCIMYVSGKSNMVFEAFAVFSFFGVGMFSLFNGLTVYNNFKLEK